MNDTLAAENAELRAKLDQLAKRVIAAEEKNQDDAELARENADLRRQLADAPTSEAAAAKLREWVPDYEVGATHVAMPVATARKLLDRIAGLEASRNAANAMNGVHERTVTRLRVQLEQAKLAPGPTGLARVWSGYNDDECWFPAFADLADAKAYAEAAFRVSCAELDAGEPGEITWKEREARTDHTGYPDMWDLKSDVGGDGWVVCGLLVHPDLASGLREQPIEQPEPDGEPLPQIPGQGVLPVETATVHGFRVDDPVGLTGRAGWTGTGHVARLNPGAEHPIGAAVEGWPELVWCKPGEVRHLDAAEIAALPSGEGAPVLRGAA